MPPKSFDACSLPRRSKRRSLLGCRGSPFGSNVPTNTSPVFGLAAMPSGNRTPAGSTANCSAASRLTMMPRPLPLPESASDVGGVINGATNSSKSRVSRYRFGISASLLSLLVTVPERRMGFFRHEDLSPEGHHHLSPLVTDAGFDTYHTSIALSRLVDVEHGRFRIERVAVERRRVVHDLLDLEIGDGPPRHVGHGKADADGEDERAEGDPPRARGDRPRGRRARGAGAAHRGSSVRRGTPSCSRSRRGFAWR